MAPSVLARTVPAKSFVDAPMDLALQGRVDAAVGTVVAAVLEISGLIGIAVCEDVNRETGFDLFLVKNSNLLLIFSLPSVHTSLATYCKLMLNCCIMKP